MEQGYSKNKFTLLVLKTKFFLRGTTMKRLFSLLILLLFFGGILTSCESFGKKPPSPEPVEYHVTEVKKTWGDDKFAPDKELKLNKNNHETVTDDSLIIFDKEEVRTAVTDFVNANFDPNYPVTEVDVRDHIMYLAHYDGRLCCVIDEFFICFINTKEDGTAFDDHIHCGAIVFLE